MSASPLSSQESLRALMTDFLCPVCLEPFDHPVTLPNCCHNICRRHVITLARYHNPASAVLTFPCPKCRGEVTFPSEVQTEAHVRVNHEMKAAVDFALKLANNVFPSSESTHSPVPIPHREMVRNQTVGSRLRRSSCTATFRLGKQMDAPENTQPPETNQEEKVLIGETVKVAGERKPTVRFQLNPTEIPPERTTHGDAAHHEWRHKRDAEQRKEERVREWWRKHVVERFHQELQEKEKTSDAIDLVSNVRHPVVEVEEKDAWDLKEAAAALERRVREAKKEQLRAQRERDMETTIMNFIQRSQARTDQMAQERVQREHELRRHAQRLHYAFTEIAPSESQPHASSNSKERTKRDDAAREPHLGNPPSVVDDLAEDHEITLALLKAEVEAQRVLREAQRKALVREIAEEHAMGYIQQRTLEKQRERPFGMGPAPDIVPSARGSHAQHAPRSFSLGTHRQTTRDTGIRASILYRPKLSRLQSLAK